MPQPFVNITAEFAELCATHILITPNERLAREYRFAFDSYQRASGAAGWQTLRCRSLHRHLLAELRRAQDQLELHTELVAGHTLMNLIVQHAPWPSAELAQTFAAAWQTVHRYDIDTDAAEFQSATGEFFRVWLRQVKAALPPDVVLEEQVGDLLRELDVAPATPLMLIGFEAFTAVERRYLDHLAGKVDVAQITTATGARPWGADLPAAAPDAPMRAQLSGFMALADEVAAAADWARQVKTTFADARIGIVVPNLAQHYELVQRQCAAILDPAAGSLGSSFDQSAGISLRDQPAWRHARRLLQAVVSGLNPATAEFLGCSPFLALPDLTGLAATWPRQLPATVSFSDIARATAATAAVAELAQKAAAWPARGDFAFWLKQVRAVLDTAGWPRITDLNSNQFQAVQAITQAFDQYQAESNQTAGGRISFATALRLLDVNLGQRQFAPQRPRSDILVLGLLETTGLQFTHLWVCGLDENNFPGRSIANPFIPRATAARHGVPRSTQADELAFATAQLGNWQRQSDELRLSYSHSQDDTEQRPSPLLGELAPTPRQPPQHPYFVKRGAARERYIDTHGARLAVAGSGIGGGTALLRDQADCPFKAYARYRLGLKRPQQIGDFPDALVRGNLLHGALFDLVRAHSTQDALCAIDTATVAQACRRALDALPVRLPDLFVEAEINRLTNLILEWLVLEGVRQPFEVIHLEETFILDLGGLQLRIRIDRIDRIDEQLVVIDYKTGKVSLAGVTKIPTIDPQLPAYSLIDDAVAGVYYAEVRDEPRLIGVAGDKGHIDGSRLTSTPYPWSQQRRQWRADLDALAAAFATGQAGVEPLPGACTYCELQNFCRVDAGAA